MYDMSEIIVIILLLNIILFVIIKGYQYYREDLYRFFNINRSNVKSIYVHLLDKEKSTLLSRFLGLSQKIKSGYIIYYTPYDKIRFKIIKPSFSEEEKAILQKLGNLLRDSDYTLEKRNKILPLVSSILCKIYCGKDAIPVLQELETNS